MAFNPYTSQIFLFVQNGERAALGQFMRDFGSQLEGFHFAEDTEMRGVSTDGNGPPDGWCFASWCTWEQGVAFTSLLPDMPAGTMVDAHLGQEDYDAWLASFGMQRILDD